MDLQHPPAELRCCPGVWRVLCHHLRNADTSGAGLVARELREEVSPRRREHLERVADDWSRVRAISDALVPDPALCAAGRELCEGDACARKTTPGHHERLITAAVQAHEASGGLELIDRLYQILASDRLARRER